MKVGNQGQAVVLAIVAVAAIGFLFLRLKGGPALVSTAQPSASTTAAEVKGSDEALPRSVFGDPFSHPALPRAEAVKPEVVAAAKKNNGELMPMHLVGNLEIPGLPGIGITPDSVGKSAPALEKSPTLLLRAIVSDPSPVAFLSVDGKEPLEFKIGSTIVDGVTITGIRDGSIEIRLPKGSKSLSVGETLHL